MSGALQILKDRGFVQQSTGEAGLEAMLASGGVTFYVGFDPTADSLHCGSLLPIMAMAHLQRAGHHPIAILGGGTTMIGDPSGKTQMRQMMSIEQIDSNALRLREQIGRYVDFTGGRASLVNNADWLRSLNYIEFLRDIGRHFRVNEMLRADAYRSRLEAEQGLSFIEFNYQLLQAYDFLHLFRTRGCRLQMGGNDQWGNILAGVDLIHKVEGDQAHGLTFPLLTTARGEKMGKTAGGAVWLDAARTSPYEFYQYWINCDDADVARFLAYFTFLPMEEVRRLGGLQGADLRKAKEVLAFEVTSLTHGGAEAAAARAASHAAFGGDGEDFSAMPAFNVPPGRLEAGIPAVDLLIEVGFAASRAAAKRLIEQGGAYVNNQPVTTLDRVVGGNDLTPNGVLLRFGKKRYARVVVSD